MAKYGFDPDETRESMKAHRIDRRYRGHKLARGVRRTRSSKAMQFEEIPLRLHTRVDRGI